VRGGTALRRHNAYDIAHSGVNASMCDATQREMFLAGDRKQVP